MENHNKLLNRICWDYFNNRSSQDTYLSLSEAEFIQLVPLLPDLDIVLIALFGVENFEGSGGFTLFYTLEKRGSRNIVFLLRHLANKATSSVATYFPSACWFEREVRDGFGIEFTDAYDKRRLFLHSAYSPDFHPLLKSFPNHALSQDRQLRLSGEDYAFKEVSGSGVYQVPVGPVHAGIIEPGHFRFSVIGETIANLEIRMFYKHRGIEKLAEGKPPDLCLGIAETISGDETLANALAFCTAVEKISNTAVPERARYLRTILLEMERVYSHLGDLAGMIVDIAFSSGASDFHILREEILRYNAILTGSRFLKNMLCLGGIQRDIPPRTLLMLSDYLDSLRPRFERAVDYIHRTNSVIDRLETTGVIRRDLINPLNITGPAARASGMDIDNRMDHPFGVYSITGWKIRTAEKGDVLSRFDVKAVEIRDSINIIQELVHNLPGGSLAGEYSVQDGYALALVEAARGQNLHWVYIRDGLIDRYKIRTASFCNWQAIEHAVIGNIVPDFPLINKSLNLSYAGTDL